jgi:cyclophilin family peptidyl-prolyl cis-trans isomerase
MRQSGKCNVMGLLHLIFFILIKICAASDARISFVNFSTDVVILYWQNVNDEADLVEVGSLVPYASFKLDTFIGHSFVYEIDGVHSTVGVEKEDSIVTMGPTNILVECSTSTGDIHALIKAKWSPHGAARFLELVDIDYFTGCALNRVVPGFLTQFGISADYQIRTAWRMKNIPDDKPLDIDFKRGYMSYAGSGEDSRSTEVFIVMPDTSEEQLSHFGENSWETPFGFVDMGDAFVEVVNKWYPYGDMPPWGDGPDSQRIYMEDGYRYLKKKFPLLSYIQQCKIVGSVPAFASDEEDEEL